MHKYNLNMFAQYSKHCSRNLHSKCLAKHILLVLLLSFSYAAMGQADNEVYLDDRESHNWSYYSDSACHVRSLNPADVRIRYFAYGTNTMYSSDAAAPTGSPDVSVAASAVGIGIDAPHKNTYVYLKTLERVNGEQAVSAAAADGPCFYRLIPNPYSLRPTYGTGDTRWRGFHRWRLKALNGGAVFRDTAMTIAVPVGTMLEAEDTVYFMPAAEYGMQVDFEAIWARAFVYPTLKTFDQAMDGQYATGVNAYERNFVVHSNCADCRWQRSSVAPTKDLTLTAVYPDGTDGISITLLTEVPTTPNLFNTNGWKIGRNSNLLFLPWQTIKFEYIKLSGGTSVYFNDGSDLRVCFNGARLICGRMCLPEDGESYFLFNNHFPFGMSCLCNSQVALQREKKIRLRLESGHFNPLFYAIIRPYGNALYSIYGKVSVHVVLGNDYDRSLGDNSKLSINGINAAGNIFFADPINKGAQTYHFELKSGIVKDEVNDNVAGVTSTLGTGDIAGYQGTRTLTMEGGIIPDISGSHDLHPDDLADQNNYVDSTHVQVRIYIKGGRVLHGVWGGGNRAPSKGIRRMVFTGGEVDGWIAGGCNGITSGYGGQQIGDVCIYFGGHARLQHTARDSMFWYSYGGNLYGAGSGHSSDIGSNSTVGKVNTTYVVVADSAYISRDVHGGGNRGYTHASANVQILGGTVEGKVFGGSNQQRGAAATIEMRGGHVVGGIHGGCNQLGTMSGLVNVHIKGGTVGSAGCVDTLGNVFGGGYGQQTAVAGEVRVTIGSPDATHPHANAPLIHGHVFGGGYGGTVTSALQPVKVTTYNGRIQKSIFGGGFGTTAITTGNTNVKILGTTMVMGNVYGGGNMGKVKGNTHVVIGD